MRVIRDFQLPLFGGLNTSQIVNVASVPQRSPFRYPGGKTWLVPLVRQWLIGLPKLPPCPGSAPPGQPHPGR